MTSKSMIAMRDSPLYSAHLFIPATRPEFASKAAISGAPAVIIDLEDSISSDRKEEGRANVPGMVTVARSAGQAAFVRVNNDPSLLRHDFDTALRAGATGVVIPKVESVAQLTEMDAWATEGEGRLGLQADEFYFELQVETAVGVLQAPALATAVKRTISIMLGVEDFATELGVDPDFPETDLSWAHGLVVLAATAAAITPYGMLNSFSNYRDIDAYKVSAKRSKAFGYKGSYCIHPAQVPVVRAAFRPTTEQLLHAERVLHAFEEAEARGVSAISLDGVMVDRPVAARARQLLAQVDNRLRENP